MEKVEKLLALILLIAVLLSACGGSGAGESSGGLKPAESNGGSSAKEDTVQQEEVTAEDYYRYLNEVFLAGHDLVVEGPQTIYLNDGMHYASKLDNAGLIGLASAVVEDFNGDGILEMLAVVVQQSALQDTYFRNISFDDGADFDPEKRAVSLAVYQFTYEDGEIQEFWSYPLPTMPESSWGKLCIGLEKVGMEYFIFSNVDGENMSTYGPSHFMVSRIADEQGRSLHPIYTSVLNYGRSNASNYKELLNIGNNLNIKEYSLSDLKIPYYRAETEEFREALGNRLLCVMDIDYVEFGGDDLVVTITDYTNLHSNLKDNGANWEPIELPEGYRKELPDIPAQLTDLVARLEAETGASFGEGTVNHNENRCEVSYITAVGNMVYLTWNTEADVLQGVNVSGYSATADEEWYNLKDAMLKQPELGLAEEEQAKLAGTNTSWTDYMNGVIFGDYKVSILCISSPVFSAFRN